MDKKNTMLLTVIAVATLLVAVVGATFAYFSLTTNGTGTTNVTGKTGKIPTITINDNVPNLYVTVSTAEMMKEKKETKYYAVTTDNNTNSTSPVKHDILNLTIANGDLDTKYDCTGTVTITISEDMATELEKGDAVLVLYGLNGNEETATTVDLADLKDTESTKTEQINFNVTGNVTKAIKAEVYIENRDAEQNGIAGKTLKVQLDSSLNCPVSTAA